MAIKKITLENYKCFSTEQVVNFTVPTGDDCSGLNILVGENNSGKTAVLSSITKLKKNADLEEEEKNDGKDVKITFQDKDENIKLIENRPGGALVVPSSTDLCFSYEESVEYIKDTRVWIANASSDIGIKQYSQGTSLKRDEIDGNLSRVLTKLENDPDQKHLLTELNETLKKIVPSFKSWTTQKSRGIRYINYEMLNGKSQGIDYALGSGILNLFRILVGLIVNEEAEIIVIDEPEAFLHPKAQEALSEVLIEKSKQKQIILATHSPYIFRKPIQQKANVLLFKRNDIDDSIEIKNLNQDFGLLGTMSPTYAEISFHAYGIYSPEFHNELYGFVHSKLVDSKRISDVDEYLVSRGDGKRDWIKDGGNVGYEGLSTYIRNYIHHPEQKEGNEKYYDEDLIESTDFLIKCLNAQDPL